MWHFDSELTNCQRTAAVLGDWATQWQQMMATLQESSVIPAIEKSIRHGSMRLLPPAETWNLRFLGLTLNPTIGDPAEKVWPRRRPALHLYARALSALVPKSRTEDIAVDVHSWRAGSCFSDAVSPRPSTTAYGAATSAFSGANTAPSTTMGGNNARLNPNTGAVRPQ